MDCSSGSHQKDKIWEKELTFNQIVSRIFEPAFALGTRYIAFSGGEFLLRKDCFELLQEADRIGFRISVVSNGSTLSSENIIRLKRTLGDNLLITLGINSFEDKDNLSTRNIEATSILLLINRLEEQHINMNICITIGKHTAAYLSDTIDHIRRLKLPHNRIPYVPRHSEARHLMFDKETMMSEIHPVLRRYFHGYVSMVPFFVKPDVYESFSGQNEDMQQVPTNPSVGCWCGSFYSITPEGEVSPCPLLGDHFSGGNVKDTDLESILYKSDLFTKIIQRKDFGGKCGSCRYRFTCGGCRSMAYYHTGNLFGEDPTCFINELSEDELQSIEREMEQNFKQYTRMSGFGGLYKRPE